MEKLFFYFLFPYLRLFKILLRLVGENNFEPVVQAGQLDGQGPAHLCVGLHNPDHLVPEECGGPPPEVGVEEGGSVRGEGRESGQLLQHAEGRSLQNC